MREGSRFPFSLDTAFAGLAPARTEASRCAPPDSLRCSPHPEQPPRIEGPDRAGRGLPPRAASPVAPEPSHPASRRGGSRTALLCGTRTTRGEVRGGGGTPSNDDINTVSRCGLRPPLDLLHFRSLGIDTGDNCGLRPPLDLLHFLRPSFCRPVDCGLRPPLDLLH